MSIFDFFRGQNAFDPSSDNTMGGTPPYLPNNSGPVSWTQAIQRAMAPQQQQAVAQAPQAPAPPTRQQMPQRNTGALDDIINPSTPPYLPQQQSPFGPYDQGYRTPYGYPQMSPDPDLAHPQLDKYAGMLDQFPQRPSPSWMRTLATGALSFANAQQPDEVKDTIGPNGKITRQIAHGQWKPMDIYEADKVLNMPYEQKLSDYGNELKARAAGAQLERQTNTDRSLAFNRTAGGVQKLASIGQGQQKVDIAADRARIAAFSAETRARVEALAEATKDMTDSEKAQYAAQNRIDLRTMQDAAAMQRVQAEQAGATKRTGMQQTGANERNDATIAGALERNVNSQMGADYRAQQKQDTGALDSQKIKGQQLRANQAIRDHPEWGKYIKYDQNDIPTIVPTGGWWGSPDQATYDAIKAYLDAAPSSSIRPPKGPAPNYNRPKTNAPAQQTQQQQQQFSGQRAIIIGPDGKRFTLPVEQKDDFLKLHRDYKAGN